MSGATRINSRTQPAGRPSVMIVSRNADLGARIHCLLPRLAHHIAETHDDAIHALRVHEPSLAVIDMVSVPSVAAITADIRQQVNGATCRVLLLPNALQESACIDALLSGADDYLNQPFADDEFVDRSNLLLRLGQTLARLAQSSYLRPVSARTSNAGTGTERDVRSTAVRTLTEIAELVTRKADQLDDEDCKELLAQVGDRTQRLARLIDSAL